MINNNFLEACYEEERSLVNQLIALHDLIIARGGVPRFPIGNYNQSDRNTTFMNILKYNTEFQKMYTYNTEWTWEEKALYVINRLEMASSPKEIIERVYKLEPNTDRNLIAGNLYNAIKRLSDNNKILKVDWSDNTTRYYKKI